MVMAIVENKTKATKKGKNEEEETTAEEERVVINWILTSCQKHMVISLDQEEAEDGGLG